MNAEFIAALVGCAWAVIVYVVRNYPGRDVANENRPHGRALAFFAYFFIFVLFDLTRDLLLCGTALLLVRGVTPQTPTKGSATPWTPAS